MTRADFSGASLRGADLTDCILDWAWLVDTDLRDAILERTRFVGARLARTKLSNYRKYHLGSFDRAVFEGVEDPDLGSTLVRP